MLAPPGDLLRAGLGLKINQVRRATHSYLRDRTDQATGTLTSYAIAAGMFAAAGVFLIAASLVGATALFRWVEIKYGMFPAFGVVGGLLLIVAAACAGFAAARLKTRTPEFPSLTSRLRVAVKANPIKSGQIEPTDAVASATSYRPQKIKPGFRPSPQSVRTGLILAATLAGGWAAARRRQARRSAD
jgi:Putative Actinobacterial Holin-X, holin superfamily III